MSRRHLAAALLAIAVAAAMLTGVFGGATAQAATTAGCGKAPTLTNGSHTIRSGGQNRSYILRLPDGYDRNRPYTLMFGFHWLNGTANDVATGGADGANWAYYGQQRLSGDSAILVAPQGIDNGWANTGGRDLTLVDDLVALIESDLCVDTSRLFAMGWSYGGSMSYAVACARPGVFRGVAVLSGANLSGCSGGTQPVAYLGIHGTHDSVLDISLGRGIRDTFVRANGCTAQNPPEPARGSLTHVVTAYTGCRAGYPVTWAAFDGDHTPSPVDGTTATSGSRTWTGAEIGRFFAQLPSTTTPSSSPSSSPSGSPSSSPSGSPSSSPSSSPSTSPSGPAASCAVVYRVVNSWQGGFQAEVTITNTTPVATTGWRVGWTLPAGQSISQVWNGVLAVSGSAVTVTNAAYNGSVAPGASATFGLLVNGSPAITPALVCTPR